MACPRAPPPRALHGGDPRRLPARLVDSRAGRRPAGAAVALQRRRHPHAPEPLLGVGALTLLPLRARDHAVRHGVDHPPAPHRRHPDARAAAEGGRSRLREDQPVHALPHGRALGGAGDRLRIPVQAPERAPERERGPARDHHPHAHRGLRAPHVDGRADHEARHRQRHLAPDLRLDPRVRAGRRQRVDQRRHDGAPLLPDHRDRRRRRRRLRAGGPAPDPRAVRAATARQPPDDRRRHVHAAAREHGGRHPGHLRRGDHGAPADGRTVRPGVDALREPPLPADERRLPRSRGAADHRLHVLLHLGAVQPGRPGRQPAQVRRLHPGHPSRAADRGVSRPRAAAPDAAGLALPRNRRGGAEPLHQVLRLLAGDGPRARRHLRADRRRRRARHDAPDGVADDDAPLRRLPSLAVPS